MITHREEIRKNSITIPMSEDMKNAIKAAARAEGLTMATFVRYKLLKMLEKENEKDVY